MSIFTENYLHELPEEIQIKIIKLSKMRKYNIVYYTKNEEMCFINHLIDININNKILDFEYTIKGVEYDVKDENSEYFYDKYLYLYYFRVLDALQEYINEVVSNCSIDTIRKKLFYNKQNNEIEEIFKERYPIHYDKMELKKDCYIRAYYALTIGSAYCHNWGMKPCE